MKEKRVKTKSIIVRFEPHEKELVDKFLNEKDLKFQELVRDYVLKLAKSSVS